MSLEDLGITDYAPKTLLIDADIVIYQACCVFTDDSDQARRMIMKQINSKIETLMTAADCDRYIMFVTTKFNFRDQLVDDYKANRVDAERPVNLAWAKRWAVNSLNNHFHKGLEADDLLGIFMTKMDDVVLWSIDKDLRQIPGQHLDDKTQKVVTVTDTGVLKESIHTTPSGKKKSKVYFDGTIGLLYQILIGDSTDHILGCAKRVDAVRKSGEKKGEAYIKRVGVGPKEAIKILTNAALNPGDKSVLMSAWEATAKEYAKVHGKDWQEHLETQANLLFMVRRQYGEVIKRWTYDFRAEYFDLVKGEILYDYHPTTN